MPNEFIIKNGFISKGDSVVEGTLSGTSILVTTTPTSGITTTQILMRNSTTGAVEITDNTSPGVYNFGLSYAMTNYNFTT